MSGKPAARIGDVVACCISPKFNASWLCDGLNTGAFRRSSAMSASFWMILFGIKVIVLNILVTRRVIRARITSFQRIIFLMGIWLIPYLGAFLAHVGSSSPPAEQNRVDNSWIPWD